MRSPAPWCLWRTTNRSSYSKSGTLRVDVEKVRQHLGARSVRQATPNEVRAATGQSPGEWSPVGWPQPVPCLIDSSLSRFAQLWAACGTPNAVFAPPSGESFSDERHPNFAPLDLARLFGALSFHVSETPHLLIL